MKISFNQKPYTSKCFNDLNLLCSVSCVCVYLFNSLNELQEFIKDTDAGLQRELSEGDHCGLVDIMGHLLAVRSRQRATDELFDPLKETITLLEAYGQKMPEQVHAQLEVSAEPRERPREAGSLPPRAPTSSQQRAALGVRCSSHRLGS